MRNFKSIILCFCSLVFLTVSCDTQEDEVYFDQSLLIGKWQSGTELEKYQSDNTGATWDTADDVEEEEAQKFTWTLEKDNLEQIHLMQEGGKVPKEYTITLLTSGELEYSDSYGKTKRFKKVN